MLTVSIWYSPFHSEVRQLVRHRLLLLRYDERTYQRTSMETKSAATLLYEARGHRSPLL